MGRRDNNAGFLTQLETLVAAHELVKVKTSAGKKKEAKALALNELIPALGENAHLIAVLGHTVILYRPNPTNPKIDLQGLLRRDPNDLLKGDPSTD